MINLFFLLLFVKLDALQKLYIDSSGKALGTNYFTNLQLALQSMEASVEIVILNDLIISEKILIEKSITIR